ncbi:OmpA family protein [Pyxidicoccus fallax]|uniref:OmpA family protein n=1 Tax=Pyxidicoccus fallax TaxID=394095 RepID=A0A848LSJ5_9BACT|nr:OmpA family protein [Pyxidicoccus fallax]NMO20590.1 OmpA family protein [Pyxidicoccus fallax]NPC83221.1 OmpA family protein [Pyxidicoccus fallax]
MRPISPSPWSRRRRAGAVLALLMPGMAALAAEPPPLPAFDLERLTVTPTSRGALLGSAGLLLEPGALRLAVVTHYQHQPLVMVRDGRRVGEVVRERALLHLAAAVAPHPRLEVGASVPVLMTQGGMSLTGLGLGELRRSGMGTPMLRARVGLVREADGALVDLAAEVDTGLPLGRRDALLGDGNWSVTPRLAVGKTFQRMRVSLEAGARVRERVQVGSHSVGAEVPFALGVTNVDGTLRGELSFRAAAPLTGGGLWSGEVLAGARYLFSEHFEVFALGGPGVGVAPGVPIFRLLAGVGFDPLPLLPSKAAPPMLESGGVREGLPGDGPLAMVEPPVAEDGEAPPEREVESVLDQDADSVADGVDNCPREPGPPGNQGCPESERQVVYLTEKTLEITERIFFAFDRTEVLPRSYPLMEQVAKVLREHPELERVVVEGHTDNIGGAEYNRRLSQARAESVCRELERRGVEAKRLRAVGRGPDAPADTNATAAGRERNRRVEFHIVPVATAMPGSAREATP